MRKFIFRAAILLMGALPCSASGALAQETGNPASGQAFARANCASCHAVDKGDDYSPNPDAPTFDSVAATPGMTGHALAVWLQTPHPTMPNFIVAPADQDNIIAYILSLKAPSEPPKL